MGVRNGKMRHSIKPFLAATLAGIFLSFTGCADASSESSTLAPVAASDAASWEIQSEVSHIRFSAKQEGEAFSGEFQTFSGTIQFDPTTPETGLVNISIPLSSVEAGSRDRNSTLPGKIWFSEKSFPVANFRSNGIAKKGDGFLAKGELTLKGKTLPIDLPFDLKIDGDLAVMTARVDMDRTLWDVGAAPWNTDEWVSRNVALNIQVTAKRLD